MSKKILNIKRKYRSSVLTVETGHDSFGNSLLALENRRDLKNGGGVDLICLPPLEAAKLWPLIKEFADTGELK